MPDEMRRPGQSTVDERSSTPKTRRSGHYADREDRRALCRETTLIDLAADGTPADLEFAYTLLAAAKLMLTAHEAYLPKPKLAVESPGGVQASFDFRGRRSPPRDEYFDQRPRRDGVRMMHNLLLRLALSSVDVRYGRTRAAV
jgi:hypothetical protein